MIKLLTIYKGILSENIGIQRIEAFLKKNGIEVETIYISTEMIEDDSIVLSLIKSNIIGISIFAYTLPQTEILVKKIKKKKKDICIFAGSQYFTTCYETVLKYIPELDFGVLGHGEFPILEFIKNFNGNNIQDLVNNSPFLLNKYSRENKKICIIDIKQLPWPTHKKEILEKDMFAYLNTSHGCVGNCTFCGHVRNPWTGRGVSQILEEIVRLHNMYKISAFSFSDNSFEDPGKRGKKRIFEIASGIINLNKRMAFNGFLRADSFKDSVEDINLLKTLRIAGFNQFLIGIEAGNKEDLLLYNKRASLEQNILTLTLLKKCGIRPSFGFININPYSTPERLKDNHQFLKEVKNFFPGHYFSYLTIYENTTIYHEIKKDGLMINKGINFSYHIQNELAQLYYGFVKDNFIENEFSQKLFELQNLIKIINYLTQILNDDTSDKELEIYKEKLYNCNNEFFDPFFLSFNFTYLYNNIEYYKKEIILLTKEIRRIYTHLLRHYYNYRKTI